MHAAAASPAVMYRHLQPGGKTIANQIQAGHSTHHTHACVSGLLGPRIEGCHVWHSGTNESVTAQKSFYSTHDMYSYSSSFAAIFAPFIQQDLQRGQYSYTDITHSHAANLDDRHFIILYRRLPCILIFAYHTPHARNQDGIYIQPTYMHTDTCNVPSIIFLIRCLDRYRLHITFKCLRVHRAQVLIQSRYSITGTAIPRLRGSSRSACHAATLLC